jgi:hypothetical protein
VPRCCGARGSHAITTHAGERRPPGTCRCGVCAGHDHDPNTWACRWAGRTACRGAFRYAVGNRVLGFMSGVGPPPVQQHWTIAATPNMRVGRQEVVSERRIPFQARSSMGDAWCRPAMASAVARRDRGVEVGAGARSFVVRRRSPGGRSANDARAGAEDRGGCWHGGRASVATLPEGFTGDAGLRDWRRSIAGAWCRLPCPSTGNHTRPVHVQQERAGALGLTDNHATSPRAARITEPVGVALKISF